jgi:hypothetical protein
MNAGGVVCIHTRTWPLKVDTPSGSTYSRLCVPALEAASLRSARTSLHHISAWVDTHAHMQSAFKCKSSLCCAAQCSQGDVVSRLQTWLACMAQVTTYWLTKQTASFTTSNK